ncbi:MAG TPA: ATP-binding protein [Puia sp.]|nr:ATP-binding protein [Puia sp.]
MRLTIRPGIVIHRKIAWLLLFLVFSLALASWLIYVSKKNIDRTTYSIDQTYEINGRLQQILNSVSESYRYLPEVNGEAPMKGRGYGALLREDAVKLRENSTKLRGLHEKMVKDLDSLRGFTRNNHDQQENIALLRNYILLSAQHQRAGLNDTIKSLVYGMMQEEKSLLANRKVLNNKASEWTVQALVFGRLAGSLFVVIILFQLNKDITRRKAIQEQLVIAIREAQDAKQMQEQFLANMSHEIRTPMNGIKGMTELLLDTPLSGKQQELAGTIKSCANNLLVIINDILDFSKIQAGKLNIEKIDFSLKEVVGSASAIFEHRLKKKGLLLNIDIAADVPDRLTGDPHRLNQVLINLLGNAIKFTQQGRIDIRVELKERSTEGPVFLSFTVADTGIGIAADSLPYIFDSFSQAGQDISRRYGGTGLGLTICKQLLHLQGGDIQATSEVGTGSVFNFSLPYGYSEQQDQLAPTISLIQDYSNLLTGKHFLVAEDNEINQKLIDYVLKKAGGTVELVSNGAEAIRFLENGKIFDLIIMDLQMPEMDGYAATQYIRNDLHMQTPIIAMTATAMKGEHSQCLESGMDEYMTKPFEFAELYKRIGSLLNSA